MLIIRNARLQSFHAGFQPGAANTLVIDRGRILAVGTEAECQPFFDAVAGSPAISTVTDSPATPNTVAGAPHIIDARNRVCMPGFNDSHIHVWKVGDLIGYKLDLRGSTSLDDMLQRLDAWNRTHPDAAWITARGFNEAAWPESRMPEAKDIDKVISDKPVYIIRTCAHIAVTNTRAMEAAQITQDTATPQGGEIRRDSTNRPVGIFTETALGLITRHIPAPSKQELKDMYRLARTELHRYGITAATDPAVDPLLLDAYREMHADHTLGLRLNAIPILLPDGGAHPFPLPERFDSKWLRINTVKFFSDGGLSGQTAALKRPYKGSGGHGVLRLNKSQFDQLARQAMTKGFGIATHAIGDQAIDFVIDAYKEFSRSFPGQRNRIEHLGLPEEAHLEAMAAHDIATSMQAIFIKELGRNFRNYLDEDYLNACYPIRTVLEAGILTALSSDAPVVKDLNPLAGVQAAVLREDADGRPIAAHEAISVPQALRAYTVGAAAIGHMEDYGSLEAGKLADLVLLDADPLTAPKRGLSSIKVWKTFVGGAEGYDSGI